MKEKNTEIIDLNRFANHICKEVANHLNREDLRVKEIWIYGGYAKFRSGGKPSYDDIDINVFLETSNKRFNSQGRCWKGAKRFDNKRLEILFNTLTKETSKEFANNHRQPGNRWDRILQDPIVKLKVGGNNV